MPRVILNRVQLTDAEELIQCNRESREYHAPWAHPFIDRKGFELWFHGALTGRSISFVARVMETREVAGIVNLNEIVLGAFRSAYLGYYGMVRTARRGYMTEAVRLAIEYAFKDVGLHRVESNVQPGNEPSRALVQRLGFRLEGFSPKYLLIAGEWRDHERWALLADEYRPA